MSENSVIEPQVTASAPGVPTDVYVAAGAALFVAIVWAATAVIAIGDGLGWIAVVDLFLAVVLAVGAGVLIRRIGWGRPPVAAVLPLFIVGTVVDLIAVLIGGSGTLVMPAFGIVLVVILSTVIVVAAVLALVTLCSSATNAYFGNRMPLTVITWEWVAIPFAYGLLQLLTRIPALFGS